VIRDLMFKGKRRYAEFLGSEEGIATNILADRLARLEGRGIIESAAADGNRRRKHYRLTPRGVDLVPLMIEMIVWSAKHDPQSAAAKAFVRRARSDRAGLIRQIVAKLTRDASSNGV
jgi:DNA-binding HxlR family transcriptional regulator